MSDLSDLIYLKPKQKPKPSIFAICSASYKKGVIHGVWIPCNQHPSYIYGAIQTMLAESQEEVNGYQVYSCSGFGTVINGKVDIDWLSHIATLIVEYRNPMIGFLYLYWYRDPVCGLEEAFQKAYEGEYSSAQEFTKQHYRKHKLITEEEFKTANWDLLTNNLLGANYSNIRSPKGMYIFNNFW